MAEATRGAVQSIPREQHEAASALGFGWVGRHAFVIMPQALRRLLPPLVSLLVNIIQNTTIAQVIGANELLESGERSVERLTAPPPIGLGEIHSFEIYGAVRIEAKHLGVGPDLFLRFIELFMGHGLHGTPIAVAECNREQIGLIEHELQAGLGLTTHRCSSVRARTPSVDALLGSRHRDHRLPPAGGGRGFAAPLRIPVYRVALAPEFTYRLIRQARNAPRADGRARDRRYGPVFRRMLAPDAGPPRGPRALHGRPGVRPRHALEEGAGHGSVYVSPLIAREVVIPPSLGLRRIKPGRYLETDSVECLKAQLALDLAAQ